MKTWLENFWYQAIKKLLVIKGNPKKTKLLRTCLGQDFDEYLAGEQLKLLHQLYITGGAQEKPRLRGVCHALIGRDMERVGKQELQALNKPIPLKTIVSKGLTRVVVWKV